MFVGLGVVVGGRVVVPAGVVVGGCVVVPVGVVVGGRVVVPAVVVVGAVVNVVVGAIVVLVDGTVVEAGVSVVVEVPVLPQEEAESVRETNVAPPIIIPASFRNSLRENSLPFSYLSSDTLKPSAIK
jgi:hypothetical protein